MLLLGGAEVSVFRVSEVQQDFKMLTFDIVLQQFQLVLPCDAVAVHRAKKGINSVLLHSMLYVHFQIQMSEFLKYLVSKLRHSNLLEVEYVSD